MMQRTATITNYLNLVVFLCEIAANVLIMCALRIIILIVVHVDPVALIERANALLVLSINFY